MPLEEERDFVTAVFRCNDPIHKLRVKVHLRQVKAAHIPLPHFVNEDKDREHDAASSVSITGESISASATSEARTSANGEEERTFSWQEKVFSPFELELYKDSANCHTALQEQYHQEVTRLHSQGQQNRIFSYVHTDHTSALDEDNEIIFNGKPFKNHLVRALHHVHDREFHTVQNSRRKDVKAPKKHIIEQNTNIKSRLLKGFPEAVFQKMYLMADLGTSSDIGMNEYVLCILRWDPTNGTLLITPDVGGPPSVTPPYRIEVDGDARNVYEYWLEHVSGNISEEECIHEAELRAKMYSHQAEMRHLHVGETFSLPKPATLNTHIYGQITTLRNFQDYNLFVHYFLELPEGWSCENCEQLSGVTASTRSLNGLVNLGHPVQLDLQLSLAQLEDSTDKVPRWPQLMLEVLSLDWWGRYRTEGYGYVTLPVTAGSHFLTIHTWRPVGRSPASELRRFFIGGNPELDDPTFVGVPVQHESPFLGKYGVQTVPTGNVDLKLHVILHHPIGTMLSVPMAHNALMERLSSATLVNSVNQVLAAFRRAHLRMLAAKQGLETPAEQ